MAAKPRGFEGFDAVFGEAKPEWHQGAPTAAASSSSPLRPLLFYVYAADTAGDGGGRGHPSLRVVATDFHSLAWDRALSLGDLDDLRDDIGVGGSWSEFVDYLRSSLSVGEVKLVAGEEPDPNSDLSNAKLVAMKAKGLPRIAISLNRLAGSAYNDAMANFSLALYTAYMNKREEASKEQERSSGLMESLSSEREKNEILQKQLEDLSFLNKRKAPKAKLTDQAPSVSNAATTSTDQVVATVQQQPSVASPGKVSPAQVTKRVAPVSRRARVRGALLQDSEDDDNKQ